MRWFSNKSHSTSVSEEEERIYRNNLRKFNAKYGRGGRRQMNEDSDSNASDDDDSEEIAKNNGKMRRTQTLPSMGGGHPMMSGMNSQYGQQPMMMMPQKPQLMKSASAGSRQMPDPSSLFHLCSSQIILCYSPNSAGASFACRATTNAA